MATIWCANKYPWCFYFFSLSRWCCLYFCKNKFGLMLAQGYFKGQRSSTFTNCIFMTLCDMQSSSGNYSMRHQVPMVSLLLLVYVTAVAYISVEISLGSCWRRDILRVKGQGLITNCNFLWFLWLLCDIQSSSGNYSMRHQVPMVSLLLLVNLSAVACISEKRNLGWCWSKDILRVKGQA